MTATGLEPRTSAKVWRHGWVSIYELIASGIESSCSHKSISIRVDYAGLIQSWIVFQYEADQSNLEQPKNKVPSFKKCQIKEP